MQPDILDSEQSLRLFAEQISTRKFARAIGELCGRDPFTFAFELLDAARVARNELVHEATLGFEHWSGDDEESNQQITRLQPLVHQLAMADLLISAVATVLSKEERPTSAALRSYAARLERWVFSGWDSPNDQAADHMML
ncbi:MAG TPA: hypothetical protein VFU37_19950 [Pyrinomonadaceae bacterium]|nr:hypothetical protein [Pyrinomonadaceae bacterium]